MSKPTLYIIGDIKYTREAEKMLHMDGCKHADDLLCKLQRLMEEYGVIKIDIAIDPYKFFNGQDTLNHLLSQG